MGSLMMELDGEGRSADTRGHEAIGFLGSFDGYERTVTERRAGWIWYYFLIPSTS